MAGDGVNLLMAPANGTNYSLTTSSVVPYSDAIFIIQHLIFFIIIKSM